MKRTTIDTDDGRPETELDYIGFYLHDANTLFVVDEDTQNQAEAELKRILVAAKNGTITPDMKEDQYLLSIESAQ